MIMTRIPSEDKRIFGLQNEVLGLIRDVSQFLDDQKSLGNSSLGLSKKSIKTLDTWQYPLKADKTGPGFLCQGQEDARVFLIDGKGTFFKGDPGALLKKILGAMRLDPEQVFICSGQNREQIHKRIARFRPAAVIFLGEEALKVIPGNHQELDQIQGRFFDYSGVKAMATYHPQDLLLRPDLKRPVWEAMQKVMEKAGL